MNERIFSIQSVGFIGEIQRINMATGARENEYVQMNRNRRSMVLCSRSIHLEGNWILFDLARKRNVR